MFEMKQEKQNDQNMQNEAKLREWLYLKILLQKRKVFKILINSPLGFSWFDLM